MNLSANTLWSEVLARVRKDNGELVRAWFSELHAGRLDGGILEVMTSNEAQSQYLTRECSRVLGAAAQKFTGRLVSVVFRVDDDRGHAEASAPGSTDETASSAARLNDRFTFDRFVADPGNKLAQAAAMAVAASPGDSYNPLFIFGPAGVGKTHLLQAVCRATREHNPEWRSLYTNCSRLVARVIEALDDGTLHRLHADFSRLDLLAVDDVHLLAGRDRSQEEFFHVFETLHKAQRQILLAADQPPVEIVGLEQRLASRFGSGLVVGLDPPGLEARMAILLADAKHRSLELPDDVARFIAECHTTTGQSLIAALEKVSALSGAQEAAIDLNLAERALSAPRVAVPTILKAVSRRFGIKKADVLGDGRSRKVIQGRDLCLHLARQLTVLSLEEIGTRFGGRDRLAVLTASHRVSAQATDDPKLANLLDEIASEAKNAV